MQEFDLIKTYLAPLAGPEGLGLLDDAALFKPTSGQDLVLTKDTMVEGVHFPNGRYGGDVAEKLLCVNLSDLAAKGANPKGYLLSIAWPRSLPLDPNFKDFAAGLDSIQRRYNFKLYGGDTVSTDGPLVVSATLIGEVPSGKMVTRSGAKTGDRLWLTGTIGDAFLGLQGVMGHDFKRIVSSDDLRFWDEAYYRPQPRLLWRHALQNYASAALDISDGLAADVGHLAKASGVAIEIDAQKIPLSKPSKRLIMHDKYYSLIDLLAGGDDYEIAFTAHPRDADKIAQAAESIGLPVKPIGYVKAGAGVQILGIEGKPILLEKTGFKHFL